MTRICLISDTHTKHRQVQIPQCDILLHSGDISDVGDLDQVDDFLYWFTKQPATHKCFIAGNHDFNFQDQVVETKKLLDEYPNIHYFQDSGTTLEGLNIYGSPWQPEFCDWSFNLPRGKPLADKWALIPENTNVLLTHGPPYGIGDDTGYDKVGCWDLIARIHQLKELKLHVFGHIHGDSYGTYKMKGAILVNASLVNNRNQIIHEPIVVDL